MKVVVTAVLWQAVQLVLFGALVQGLKGRSTPKEDASAKTPRVLARLLLTFCSGIDWSLEADDGE